MADATATPVAPAAEQTRKMTLRIAGVILPDTKPVGIALTYLFGVGHASAKSLLAQVAINPQLRVRDLSAEQVEKIRKTVEERFTLENQLRQEILTNIRRLKEISSYRGSRHAHNLPVRGQRTRTNARTKRGKKVTVGSGRKKSSEKT